jgi:hypothetical protein
MNPNQYPQPYIKLIHSQNSIGWDQLYKGQWSKEWQILQDAYTQRQHPQPSTSSSHSWVLFRGHLLLDQWLDLWQLRNLERYGKDALVHRQARLRILTSELQELYSYRDKVHPADQQIFYASVEQHLEHHPSLDHIEDWISTHHDAIKASAQQATTLAKSRN